MSDPISTQDLYGGTAFEPHAPEPPPPPSIPVEETPEIPLDAALEMPLPPQIQAYPPPPAPKKSHGSCLIGIFIVIIFIAVGWFFSGYFRTFLTGVIDLSKQTVARFTAKLPSPQTAVPVRKTDEGTGNPPPSGTSAPSNSAPAWTTYTVSSGGTIISGLSYSLPPNVKEPTCDGTSCVSKGTYLPGGTRFTVALKNVTQPLSSLKGAVITDAANNAFTSHDMVVSGHTAIEFSGAFAGRTSGGFGFTQMHGFMIEVTPTLTLEINHFAPEGVTVDWAQDDVLFTQLISTFTFPPPITSGS